MIFFSEKKVIFSVAGIYLLRMLGLFIILPILSLYIDKIIDATPRLMGIALGIYGLTQALLQIILGTLSDYYDRRSIIIYGLCLFILGSVIAAFSETIYGIIIGRALQGSGAIGSTLNALIADVTQEKNRIKAMSVIGMSIGLAFTLSVILGPLLNIMIGLSGIFVLTAILGFIGIIISYFWIPKSNKKINLYHNNKNIFKKIKNVILVPELIRLNIGICILHIVLTSFFLAIPIILEKKINIIDGLQQWKIYLVVLILSFIIMSPIILIAEKKNLVKPIFLISIIFLILTQILLFLKYNDLIIISLILILFFISFNLLEIIIPALVSKISPINSKGTAMGIYSSLQFFGIFIGGSMGGYFLYFYGTDGIFIFNSILCKIWLGITIGMKQSKK